MDFPKDPNPINIFHYLIKFIVNKLKFNPNNFIHLFSLALGVNRVHKKSYGCVFIGFPGKSNYFGDQTPDNTFSIGYKIYKENEINQIPEEKKDKFYINDSITIAIDQHLYSCDLTEIATLYYLIKKREELEVTQDMIIEKTKVYVEVKDLIDYGSKVSEMIKLKHEKFEKNKSDNSPIKKEIKKI